MSAEALASPDKAAEAGGGGGGEADAELPRALMKRILKARLAQWDAEVNGGDGTRDFQVSKVRSCRGRASKRAAAAPVAFPCWLAAPVGGGSSSVTSSLPVFSSLQDALLACCEAGKLFIHYLAATANDACRDAKRQVPGWRVGTWGS